MIIDPKEFIANSSLAGLGSIDKTIGSFNVGSQSINNTSLYQHPRQRFPVTQQEYLYTILFNISIEEVYRSLDSLVQLTYDTSNTFYAGGFGITNPSARFALYVNSYMFPNAIDVDILMTNVSSTTNPITTPAFTFSLVSFVYRDPFQE